MKLIGIGSSRKVYSIGSMVVFVDNKEVEINICEKIPYKSPVDQYINGYTFGQRQNANECDTKLNNYRFLIKDKHGYRFNRYGILTPIFNGNKSSLVTTLVEPYITNDKRQTENDERMSISLKTELFHNICLTDFHESAMEYETFRDINKVSKQSKYILLNHYIGKTLKTLIEKKLISGYDITDANWGFFKLPGMSNDIPVLLDYGMKNEDLTLLSRIKSKMKSGV